MAVAQDAPVIKSIKQSDRQALYYCDYPIWYDDWYCRFNSGMDNTVNNMNQWFFVDGESPDARATVSGKIRLGWEPRSGDLGQFDSRFKVRVKLPALEDRVELLFTDEDDNVNQQSIKAARNSELGNQEETTVAIQFRDKADSPMSYRIGFGRSSQLYARARFRQSHELTQKAAFNYFTEINYYSGDKFGAEINGIYSYAFNDDKAIEFGNSFRYRDNREDWFWRHELKYLYIYDAKQTFLFTAMIDGLSQPNYRKEQMLVSLRYKRNILRPWLFIEIEPYVIWLREENFRTSAGIAMRFEVHFPDDSLLLR